MSKLYNEYSNVVNDFRIFFSKFSNSKTLLRFVHNLFCSFIFAESITLSKVALTSFKSYDHPVLLDSVYKRISRTLHNSLFSFLSIFDSIVIDTLSRYKLSHSDKNVHISFDHMFVETKFTILMFTLRVGKQGVPIYFKVFQGANSDYKGEAFKMKHIKEGVSF